MVYFAHEAVFRFCGAGNIDDALTELFGTNEYKDASLLFGAQRSQYIHDLYKRQLHDVCGLRRRLARRRARLRWPQSLAG